MTAILECCRELALTAVIIAVAVAAALACDFVLFRVIRRLGRKAATIVESLDRHLHRPVRCALVALAMSVVLPMLAIPQSGQEVVRHILSWFVIGFVAVIVARSLNVLEDFIVSRFQPGIRQDVRARRIQTQLSVVKRIAIVALGILAGAMILMTFEKVRQLGTAILASAGIVGIVVGMAAQKTIGSFIAGLHIALSGPISIDDAVVVDNELGRIEEITLTYVVVRTWDLRRLVLPITYFIEKPFQNWSRVSADLLGTVEIYADYTAPVDAIRAELERIVKASDKWDGKTCGLQVTEATEKSIVLRAVVSAADAARLWDLRCEVREKLVGFIQANYPQALPKIRSEPSKDA